MEKKLPMRAAYYDVSIPLQAGMTVWPGDPPFTLAPLKRIEHGDPYNTSRLELSTHTGTHIDAPWHFEAEGHRLDQIDASLFFGEALLLELPNVDLIQAGDLGADPLPPRVLFKTCNSEAPPNGPFRRDFTALAPDAAQRLVDDGVRLAGVDYLSVGPYRQPGGDTHHILLGHNVVVVEGLCLNGFSSGTYEFIVLPLALVGADGAPCRAFIVRQEDTQ